MPANPDPRFLDRQFAGVSDPNLDPNGPQMPYGYTPTTWTRAEQDKLAAARKPQQQSLLQGLQSVGGPAPHGSMNFDPKTRRYANMSDAWNEENLAKEKVQKDSDAKLKREADASSAADAANYNPKTGTWANGLDPREWKGDPNSLLNDYEQLSAQGMTDHSFQTWQRQLTGLGPTGSSQAQAKIDAYNRSKGGTPSAPPVQGLQGALGPSSVGPTPPSLDSGTPGDPDVANPLNPHTGLPAQQGGNTGVVGPPPLPPAPAPAITPALPPPAATASAVSAGTQPTAVTSSSPIHPPSPPQNGGYQPSRLQSQGSPKKPRPANPAIGGAALSGLAASSRPLY